MYTKVAPLNRRSNNMIVKDINAERKDFKDYVPAILSLALRFTRVSKIWNTSLENTATGIYIF